MVAGVNSCMRCCGNLPLTTLWLHHASGVRDIIFRRATVEVQAVKPADIATFLGRKLHSNYQDEMGNRFNRRWLGTRIKHTMGPVTIKMYDKFSLILRIETTVNDVAFFDHYRQVQHRDGTTSTAYAPMKKTIYSLPPLAETLYAVHQRYLKFISDIDTPAGGADNLHHLAETEIVDNRRYKGFNLLSEEDSSLFRVLASGEFTINGFSNRTLRQRLPALNSGQVTRLIKRDGVIKRVGKHYRYISLISVGTQLSWRSSCVNSLSFLPSPIHDPKFLFNVQAFHWLGTICSFPYPINRSSDTGSTPTG
jgi:hypothetical protein